MLSQAEHSPSTVGAKGPTGTRGTRSGYDRAVGDLFVTYLTSRHLCLKRDDDYSTMPTFRTSVPLLTCAIAGLIGIVPRSA
jgi:hypothetical protein